MAWFGVGCYYQSIGRFDSARQYFGKATTMEASFAPAWLGFSHAFAAQDESDQVQHRPRSTVLGLAVTKDPSSASAWLDLSQASVAWNDSSQKQPHTLLKAAVQPAVFRTGRQCHVHTVGYSGAYSSNPNRILL